MFKTVPMTAQHLAELNAKLPQTMQGIALLEGDKTLAIGGLYLGPAHYELASFMSEELRTRMRAGRSIKALLRAAREALALARNRRLPIYATADRAFYGSANLLRHLGFESIDKDIFQWHGSR